MWVFTVGHFRVLKTLLVKMSFISTRIEKVIFLSPFCTVHQFSKLGRGVRLEVLGHPSTKFDKGISLMTAV